MGGTVSSPEDASAHELTRELRMLLGNFDRLDPMTQRLVSLGKSCLTATVSDSQQEDFRKLERFNAESATAATGIDSVCNSTNNEASALQINSEADLFVRNESLPYSENDITNEPNAASHDGLNEPGKSDLFLPLEQARPIYLGQTYPRWKMIYRLQNFYSMCVPTRRIIYIQPVDDFPDFMTDFKIPMKSLSLNIFGLLQGFTQIFFSGLDVTVMPSVSMERMGWPNLVKSRHHKVTGEKQYRARDFYPLLQKVLPTDGHCVLGLIWTDLYPEDDLNFILGETSFSHRAGMFCFGRFETKGFNRATHKDITEVDGFLIWKLIRAISHELCHLFGLRHCTYFHCSMNESTSLTEAMEQPLFLCPVCLRKLHQVCQFNVLERYRMMLDFLSQIHSQLPDQHFAKAIDWLQNCVAFLQQPLLNN